MSLRSVQVSNFLTIMIQTWHITKTQAIQLEINASTLDEVTRQLPEPDGYYSTFRTFAGGTRVLGLSAHLQRLYGPVSSPNVEETFLRRQLFALLEPFRPDEARIRVIMTRKGQVYVSIGRLAPLPHEVYERGVRVVTTELQRGQPRLKSTSFISRSDSERKHIAQAGIFEALLVRDGKILEGMTSNFFYILRAERSVAGTQRDTILGTAYDDILLGITRETVIEIARGRGLELKEQPLERDQLSIVDEAFITSSSRGIVPVIRIDNAAIGQGSPGPITKQLLAAYDDYVIQRAEKI